MKKAERVQFILDTLEQYYPETPIPLNHTDAYTLLVSVLLSAQCTDERVNQITPLLFEKANNPADMLKLSVEEIQQIIRPCGLSPMKSKGIYGLSQMIMELHNGEVPASFEALEAMPGVGHKTASVVMSQAFGVPAFPVDTHIHRLAYRWRLSAAKSVEETERDLKRLIPIDRWNKAHLQIIFMGREFCPARGHIIEKCPVCSVLGCREKAK
ncbi:MAG: endonuclease III [Bacteroidetes bacterium]|jgi:endonuclease-3|nr:endonuclease III [Bacteroidota bacterium]NBX64209.1 endonuclease III [Bacteroidota bacterium]